MHVRLDYKYIPLSTQSRDEILLQPQLNEQGICGSEKPHQNFYPQKSPLLFSRKNLNYPSIQKGQANQFHKPQTTWKRDSFLIVNQLVGPKDLSTFLNSDEE